MLKSSAGHSHSPSCLTLHPLSLPLPLPLQHSGFELKPSPLSSADNAPRSLHLNAVQAVNVNVNLNAHHRHSHSHSDSQNNNTVSSGRSSSSSSSSSNSNNRYHSPPGPHYTHLRSTSLTNPSAVATSTPTPTPTGHSLRRLPAGTNIADHRQHQHQRHHQQQQLHHHHHNHHREMRSNSLGGGASAAAPNPAPPQSQQSTPAMTPITAIAAGQKPPAAAAANGGANGGQAHGRFDGPRSPPNTSHVPCKFFRQGACQAGPACPFSHDLGAAAENVCKYFAKGNCKFGPKCANIHVLPDGRRVNYGKNGVTVTPINFGNRLNPVAYGHSSNSALTTSFMRAEAVPPYTSYANATDDRYNQAAARQPGMENGLPTIDAQYSGPASPYGSPHGADDATRIGFGLSPVAAAKGLSVLDAPLPASFDSNGISHAARYGPWPASVPNKFGIESPSPSLSNAKDQRTSETLKMLHTSAFGSSEHLSPSHLGGDVDGLGSSPPQHPIGEEFFGRRAMHSSSARYAKPRLLSASAPKVDRDWDDNFLFLEEDYVPGELANDLLTPAEKARRGSVRVADGGDQTPSGDNSAKYDSPIGASSPSRWGPLFQRQKEEEAGGSLAKSLKGTSAFGHVGSPLRNSSLASGLDMVGSLNGSSSMRSLAGSRTGSGAESLSALTQQIQRTKLNDDGGGLGSSPHLHPSAASARPTSNAGSSLGVIGSSKDYHRDRALERHVSSGSIGSSANGRFTTPIDEEDPSFVFSMEEDDDATVREKNRKRQSGGFNLGGGGGGGGGGWSYAGVVSSGKRTSGNKGSTAVETR